MTGVQTCALPISEALGVLAAFAIRGAAIRWSLELPTYRSRPGRDYTQR